MKKEYKSLAKSLNLNINFDDPDWKQEFRENAYWWKVSQQKLSESFIRENKDLVDWFWISYSQKLGEAFIRENKDLVDWSEISRYQKLGEAFIREFQDEVSWPSVSRYQKLSESFIRENKNLVDWFGISRYQKLGEAFIREFNLTISKDNWLYWSALNKLSVVKDSGLYEIKGNKIIAYKSVRSDGYSVFNFQHHYEPEKVYSSHCDCTNEENSFGLSAWTKEKALEYHPDGKLFKVEIDAKDLGRMVHNGGKLRAFRMKILEEIS